MRSTLTAMLNLVVLGAFAWAVEYNWGWKRLLAPWSQIAAPLLCIALAGLMVSYGLRALRIYLAEQSIPRGRYSDCLRLILINNVMNLLLPARAGEASFPILMHRWFGIDPARATGTLVWLRLLDLHVLATVGGVCAASGWASVGLGLSRLAELGACVAAMGPPLLFVLHGRLERFFISRQGMVQSLGRRFLDGVPNRLPAFALDLALTWAAWLIKLLALSTILTRLARIPGNLGFLGAIGGDLSTVLPIHAPGGFGTYELGALALLAPGQPTGSTGTLLAAVVNLHLLVLTTALIAGAAAWFVGTMVRRTGP